MRFESWSFETVLGIAAIAAILMIAALSIALVLKNGRRKRRGARRRERNHAYQRAWHWVNGRRRTRRLTFSPGTDAD